MRFQRNRHAVQSRTLRRSCVIASALLWTLAAVAQHPAVVSSVLLDQTSGSALVGMDRDGNVYEGNYQTRVTLTKLRPDGTVAATYPLLASAAQIGFDGAGGLYLSEPICVSTCPAPSATFGAGTTGSVLFGKVNAAGDGFVWLDRVLGVSALNPSVDPVLFDSAGNVYLYGNASCSFPTTSGAYQPQCISGSSATSTALAAKFDGVTGKLIYATFLHGTTSNSSSARLSAADSAGNLYVMGQASSDWPTTPGAMQPTGTGTFLAKLSADGSTLLASTFFEGFTGAFGDVYNAMAADDQGSVYLTGQTTNYTFPTTPGAAETTFSSWSAAGKPYPAFAMKVRPDFGALVYATYASLFDNTTFGYNPGPRIGADSAGNAYLSGSTQRPSVLTVNPVQADNNNTCAGCTQGAIAVLNPQGTAYLFSSYLGGTLGGASDNYIPFVRAASDGLVHIAGRTTQDSFPALTSTASFYFYNPAQFEMSLTMNGAAAVPIMFIGSGGGGSGALAAALPGACMAASCVLSGGVIPTTSQITVYLGNYGAAPLAFGSLSATGDFAQSNDCPASLAPGARCVITVTFRPTAIGTRTGGLALSASVLQNFKLSSIGFASLAQPSAPSLQFGVQAVGTSSAAQTITITNAGNSDLVFSSIATQGDFSQRNTCGFPVPSNRTCTIDVVFTPTASGQRNGTLMLASNALQSPQTIMIVGGVTPDFVVGPSSGGTTSQTISAGQTATYNLSLAPSGGFTGTVALTCSGAPTAASCAVSPSSVNVSGTSATPFTVSVTTTARAAGASVLPRPSGTTGWMLVLLLGGMLSLWWRGKVKRVPTFAKRGQMWATINRGQMWGTRTRGMLFALAFVVLMGMIGCGGGSSSKPPVQTGTPAGTYTIVVTAVSGSTTHTQNLTLTVN